MLRPRILVALLLVCAGAASAPCEDQAGATYLEGDHYYENVDTRCIVNLCAAGQEKIVKIKCAEKPGRCRRRFFIALVCSPAEIVDTCHGDDGQCPGAQKCCRTERCVTSCEEPDAPKPGTCPPPSAVEAGDSHCDVDSDCGDNSSKCCRNQDGARRCADPAGYCPDTSGTVSTCEFIPGVNCLQQQQCTAGRLCCPYGCGRRCLLPAP